MPAVTLRRDRRRSRVEHAPRRRGWARTRAAAATVLLIAVSLFALVTVVIPLLMGAQTYTVLTGSMQPGMPPGTMIAVRDTPIDDVRVGDVVTYQIRSGDPAVVTHRVVGTTSMTGGERVLLTRGDANDVDDPPVRREQLRGTVVLAVPYLGYPAVLVGGAERGAVVAAIGVAVVGYGIALLVWDAIRAGRRKPAAAVAALLVAMAAGAPLLSPGAAHAASPTRETVTGDGPLEHLLVSDDGVHFVADGAVALFGAPGALTPGTTTDAVVWIRNASGDPARAGLRLRAVPPSADPADAALADALRLVVGASRLPPGDHWVSGIILPGETLRLEVGLHMDATADNVSRRGEASVTPVVQLTDAPSTAPVVPPGSAPPSDSTALAWTGLRATPVAPLVVAAAVATILGIALRVRRAERR